MHFRQYPQLSEELVRAIGLQSHGESLPIFPLLTRWQPFLELQLNPNGSLLGKSEYYSQFLGDPGYIWIEEGQRDCARCYSQRKRNEEQQNGFGRIYGKLLRSYFFVH